LTRLLLVSGSLRAGSTNAAVLRTAAALVPAGVSAEVYEGMARLPHFNPDDDAEGAVLDPAVVELRAAIGAADALLLCTPEYAGDLPGSFKNLLDWTVGGGETYGMPVAWVNVASVASPTGAADAHASLRRVLGYTGSDIVEEACVRVPVPRDAIGADGLVADPAIQEVVAGAVAALAGHAR
jgi:chromate reductase